ncbi:SufE family protein [Methylobacterium organophilum]|uniref:Cysteine desulfuration protein SufE n=1 Tax=Methylobacterium organophilum TaxID=410 RepID=A0ABQ4TE65_METOR|nr:SufE family protein [Methylobacterium organophilum]UMY18545.1 SufE family protein [Methylobacterium organophilum]GJE29513.1 Cysteine desulfuration protein SufE [Methylobacterium organophilum]
MLPPIETIIENFAFIDDAMDRYEYVIELGKALPPLPEALHSETNRVHGCESQVWLDVSLDRAGAGPQLALQGDSDSQIVKGFVALMVALYRGKSPEQAVTTDGFDLLKQLDFGAHITSKRSNGVRSMVERIQRDARRFAAEAA